MKYALLVNGKIKKTQQGLAPTGEGWVPVIQIDKRPTTYPEDFYIPKSNIPNTVITATKVTETLSYVLKPIPALKEEHYNRLSAERSERELAGFEFDSSTIPATATAQIKIPEMPASVQSFKVRNGEFISLADTQLMKAALILHIQTCYEWEDTECAKIRACTTRAQLKDLLYGNS